MAKDHAPTAPEPRGTAAAAHRGRLRLALGITASVMVAEILGGVITGSLALVADAAHMATDALGLSMALLAIHFASRPATAGRTFGLARAEILAALANCLLLLAVGGYVLYEAVGRFFEPAAVAGGPVLAFGTVGLAANLVSLGLLLRGQKESLNVRGAFLEVMADALGSVAVLVSAVIIMTTGWQAADPIASLAIGLMIVPRTLRLLRETLDVLMESAPRGLDVREVRAHLLAAEGVEEVHDLHAWTIASGRPVLSAHVVRSEDRSTTLDTDAGQLLRELRECATNHFAMEHSTFQVEPSGHARTENGLCA